MNLIKATILVAISTTILSGCAIYDTVSGKKKEQIVTESEKLREEAYQYAPRERKYSNIVFSEKYFVPPIKREKKQPDWFYETVDFTFKNTPMSAILNHFQSNNGLVSRTVTENGESDLDLEVRLPLKFKGRLGDAIHRISLATGYGYTIEENSILWSKYETRTILLSVPPTVQSFRLGDKDRTTSANNNGSIGGFGGNTDSVARQDVSDAYSKLEVKDLDTWSQLQNSIAVFKSATGKVSFDKTSSLLLIKDYPRNVRAMSNYIEQLTNTSLTKVVFDFQFLEYRSEEGDLANINWNIANDNVTISSDSAQAKIISEFTKSVLSDPNPVSIGLNILTGDWAGSNVIVETLKEHGIVSVLDRPTVIASHNKSSSIDLGRDIAYASSSGSSQSDISTQSGISTTILSIGTKINVIPTIVGNSDNLFVQLGVDLSDLSQMRVFESDGARIQNPETIKQKMLLSFPAKSGETIMITGNKKNRNVYSEEDAGLFSAFLGGSKSSAEEYSEMLILVTPRIIRPHTI
jgi:type II secretory pathway component GspD/PulD (secretin)